MSLREGLRTSGSRAFIVLAIIVTLDNLQTSGIAVLAPNIQSSFHVSTGAITLKIKQRLIGLSRTTFGSSGLSQEEILQHELPLSACKWAAANAAGYLPTNCLRPSFDFDHLIECLAVRKCE